MFKWLWRHLEVRYSWLRANHPVACRDTAHGAGKIPHFITRLSNIWNVIGLAALIHAVMFIVTMLMFNTVGGTFSTLFIPLMSPFLSPFGIPVAVAGIHSVLYWAMLIGLCNQVSSSISREIESGSWQLLELTPYSTQDLLFAKVFAIIRHWSGILRILLYIRLAALLFLPLAIASQGTRETSLVSSIDVVGVALFMAQPLVDMFMVAGLSALAAVAARTTMWGRMYAYGASALVMGILNTITFVWLTFASPLGALSGLLVPLGHWTPLAAASFPPRYADMYALQTAILGLLLFVMPLLIGLVAFRVTVRLARTV